MPATLQAPKRPRPRRAKSNRHVEASAAEQMLRHYFDPARLRLAEIDWTVLIFIALLHVGALAAPFYFTWPALAVGVVLYWLTGSIGICLGYHRCLSHRGLTLAAPARFISTLCGVWALQGSPLTWCATHRLHHARSDRPGDPHSPNDGKWWSHLLWLFVRHSSKEQKALHRRFCPELVNDPLLQMFERTYILWTVGLGIALWLAGGLPMLLWGLCVRGVVCYHSTWFVNSLTHLWGYRNYETRDDSRNNWFVAIVAWGEGWHNNHHAFPRLARSGHRWWEVDVTWWAISLLRSVGLARDVHDHLPAKS